ncbi:hypothetical protein ABEX30_08120 [Priestia aryabhattai]|uniref:hypothetical protein n=1 Tax=Priestia aryabhattai TaxID=412384 RepID=UPI003D2DB524
MTRGYVLVTDDFITSFAEWLEDQANLKNKDINVYEVGAGNGELSGKLIEKLNEKEIKNVNIIATDNKDYEGSDYPKQEDHEYTDLVKDLGAVETIWHATKTVDYLIMGWPPLNGYDFNALIAMMHKHINGEIILIGGDDFSSKRNLASEEFYLHFKECENQSFDGDVRANYQVNELEDYPIIGKPYLERCKESGCRCKFTKSKFKQDYVDEVSAERLLDLMI